MSILSSYSSEINNNLNRNSKYNIECVFYDPGYSNNSLTLATFNRCLEQFRKNTTHIEYTEEGTYGKVYNYIIKKYVTTFNYKKSNIPNNYNFHINYFNREEQDLKNKPELKFQRNIEEYKTTTQNGNNIYFRIINEKEYKNNRFVQNPITYHIIYEYTYNSNNLNLKAKLLEFYRYTEILLKFIQNTNLYYTLNERSELCRYFNNLLKGHKQNDNYTIDKNILVKSRNLKLKDITYGGLVGNSKTSYRVTAKADGKRKLMLIFKSGIWLVNPPFEFTLLIRLNDFTDFIGCCFDTELMGNKKKLHIDYKNDLVSLEARNQNYPDSEYVLLLFDVLSSVDTQESKAGTSIQNYSKSVRLTYISTFIDEAPTRNGERPRPGSRRASPSCPRR